MTKKTKLFTVLLCGLLALGLAAGILAAHVFAANADITGRLSYSYAIVDVDTGQPVTGTSYLFKEQIYRLTATWQLENGDDPIDAGDYFNLPFEFQTSISDFFMSETTFDLYGPGSILVGTGTVSRVNDKRWNIKATFNQALSDLNNIHGTFEILFLYVPYWNGAPQTWTVNSQVIASGHDPSGGSSSWFTPHTPYGRSSRFAKSSNPPVSIGTYNNVYTWDCYINSQSMSLDDWFSRLSDSYSGFNGSVQATIRIEDKLAPGLILLPHFSRLNGSYTTSFLPNTPASGWYGGPGDEYAYFTAGAVDLREVWEYFADPGNEAIIKGVLSSGDAAAFSSAFYASVLNTVNNTHGGDWAKYVPAGQSSNLGSSGIASSGGASLKNGGIPGTQAMMSFIRRAVRYQDQNAYASAVAQEGIEAFRANYLHSIEPYISNIVRTGTGFRFDLETEVLDGKLLYVSCFSQMVNASQLPKNSASVPLVENELKLTFGGVSGSDFASEFWLSGTGTAMGDNNTLTIVKKGPAGSDLAGAVFTVERLGAWGGSGYTPNKLTTGGADANGVITLTTSSDGNGLYRATAGPLGSFTADNIYKITEITAPAGLTGRGAPIYLKIDPDGSLYHIALCDEHGANLPGDPTDYGLELVSGASGQVQCLWVYNTEGSPPIAGDPPARITGTKLVSGTNVPAGTVFTFELIPVHANKTEITPPPAGFPMTAAVTTQAGEDTYAFHFDLTGLTPGETYRFKVKELGPAPDGWEYDPSPERYVTVFVDSGGSAVVSNGISTPSGGPVAGAPGTIARNVGLPANPYPIEEGKIYILRCQNRQAEIDLYFELYYVDAAGTLVYFATCGVDGDKIPESGTDWVYEWAASRDHTQAALMAAMKYSNAGAWLTEDEFLDYFDYMAGREDEAGKMIWFYEGNIRPGHVVMEFNKNRMAALMAAYEAAGNGNPIASLTMTYIPSTPSSGQLVLGHEGFELLEAWPLGGSVPPGRNLVTLSWTGTAALTRNGSALANGGVVDIAHDTILVTGISGDVTFTLADMRCYLVGGSIQGDLLKCITQAAGINPDLYQKVIAGYAEFVHLKNTLQLGGEAEDLTFTNTFTPDAEATIEGTKNVEGTNPPAGTAFTFELWALDETPPSPAPIDTYTVTTVGNAPDSYAFRFDLDGLKPGGTYHYKVTETGTAPAGWTYDPVPDRYVTVTVDANGDAAVDYGGPGSLTYTNTYSTATLSLQKLVEGGGDPDEEFEFLVTFTGPGSDIIKKGAVLFDGGIVRLKRGETAVFTDIPFGTVYSVTEINIPERYILTGGPLTRGGAILSSETAITVTYINYYKALTEIDIPGSKTVSTGAPEDEEFTFRLQQVADEFGNPLDPAPDPIDETRTGPGPFSFRIPDLEENEEGCWFTLTELPGSAEGWSYDPAAYIFRVVVTMVDDELVAQILGLEWEAFPFHNEYGGPFSFLKTDRNDKPLDGVTFKLFSCGFEGEGAHKHSLMVSNDDACCWVELDTAASAAPTGRVTFTELLVTGDYMLVETATKPGLQLPFGQWLIHADASAPAGEQFTITGVSDSNSPPPAFFFNGNNELTVKNYPRYTLPRTGISAFTLLLSGAGGTALLGTAGTLGFGGVRRRRRHVTIVRM